jgi:hypothetical protein
MNRREFIELSAALGAKPWKVGETPQLERVLLEGKLPLSL